jgi:predicted enzyme related to lactoylglutathione lyase
VKGKGLIMGNPVVHWEINAKDGSKLRSFYASLFDWKIDADNPMNYGMVDTGGTGGIAGGIGQTEGGGPTYVTFYVQVSDLQAYLDKAENLGGKTILPPTEIPGVVTIAMFEDIEGNKIGLLKG